VTVNLCFLGFFKYCNFFVDPADALLLAARLPTFGRHLNIILPVGISFYTFQSISYIVDVYRGDVEPARNPIHFALFVAFFPHMVAGPIMHSRDLLPQMQQPRHTTRVQVRGGLWLILWGFFKKLVVGDNLASIVDAVYGSDTATAGGVLLRTYAFAYQIYYDFSGYTDIARGTGKLMGFELMRNFKQPYLAVSPPDFWRRWHISLSTWLRDYLYIPLGGNRKGEARTYANLLVTMLLGGLWHGANWTFVVWGAYHGTLLALGRLAGPVFEPLPKLVRRTGTFLLVVLGFVIFRSRDLGMAGTWLAKLVGIGAGDGDVPAALMAWVAAGLLLVNLAPETWDIDFGTRLRWAPAYAAAFLVAYLFVNQQASVFLYYQF
jgi:alginate O-acetyltransferase complex protein AlgI